MPSRVLDLVVLLVLLVVVTALSGAVWFRDLARAFARRRIRRYLRGGARP